MTVTTALYRRYRPDSFADVIGQEHVTDPLMTALRKNRVNHAYLFSGPRGCGKTTSARILARCLNCAEGPTDTPCGKCNSCVELARGGSGSLDVIEIDAASHGGVDDARDLRERATFAPVRDRYKIFIIDEAHMVTPQGFNALLKIVEEPPEHIKFIFATTEPDKVIGTIKSRTHHYPFRLVPPEPLMAYLELLCQQENVPVAPGVLSLVLRAGEGSVRDTLSVLDQLIAGAGPDGLDYELAVALLGYTHASLLDDVVDAVAAADAGTVFRAVDRVIQTGHDPRRFVEDLLERFRDLIIVKAMPESAQAILRGMPADQIARMRGQANNLGAAELSRAADVTNTALTEMTGATSPRLHLELLCARVLLPSAEQTERGIAARIDRVERRLNYGDEGAAAPVAAPATAAPAAPVAAPAPVAVSVAAPAPAAEPQAPAPADSPAREPLTAPRVSTADWPVDERQPAGRPAQVPAAQAPAAVSPVAPVVAPPVSPTPVPAPAAPAPAAPAQQAPRPAGASDVEALRRAWPEVLQTLTKIKRSTWALVEPNAQVAQFDGQQLTLAFTTAGLAGAFGRADHAENLRQAIHKTIGIDCQIVAVAGGTNSSASSEPNPKAPASPEVPAPSPEVPASAVDAAWGLAPAGPAAASPAATPVQATPVQAEPTTAAAPAAPTAPAAASAAPETAPATALPVALTPAAPESEPAPVTAQPTAPSAAPMATPESAGDYAYPDDDWGPPRDEDAPPLDEEPPADWEPTGSYSAAPAGPSATEAPPSAAPKKAVPSKAAAAKAAAKAAAADSAVDPASAPDTSHDPWSRAVEQSPGSWVVGSASNVGTQAAAEPTSAQEPAPEPASEEPSAPPVYEPAGAQIPAAPAPSGWDLPPSSVWPVATAAAAPASATSEASAPATSHGSVATMEETALVDRGTGRQSLYQRLTNSPEAQAGRQQAPVRAQESAAPAVEEIPSPDDETIEESKLFGRAAVERILGAKLLEVRALDGTPLQAG
ncbi:DNA polymerase III subunit gamma and tau [Arthrobacter cavernae]|uniref:DNA polymerase III subunit gamma/tau n=1 Tax=Arthrobacter cavernae TaxID=2817681 RepID=A0A939HH64_9MICC|nr:DNA polymerase III subunit gamma and tau [Arthrobacter cavernae]MBO1269179.1 DNA polymerase III subunit gamma and tau [Arthrobacter cavernae]